MRPNHPLRALVASLLFVPALASAQGDVGGPSIDIPTQSPAKSTQADQPTELGTGRRTSIGGYGEAHLLLKGDEDAEAKLKRFVLFFGHAFTDQLKVYSELEVEDGDEFEIEQAYLEYGATPHVGVRAGLLLVPVGLINLLHEPPTFNGVERPLTDTLIIPTTWRELGAGVYGEIVSGLRYQAYVMTGLDASKFNPASGIAGGRGQGLEVHVQDAALTGRLDFTRILGLGLGLGFYTGGAGREVEELGGTRATLLEADANYSRAGVKLRAEYARSFIRGADRITAFQRETNPGAEVLGSQMQGYYLEGGYDVLHPLGSPQELVPFVRYENVNTRVVVPDVLGAERPENQQLLTAGLTWRPDPRVVVKFDYRRKLVDEDEAMHEGMHMSGEGEAEEAAESELPLNQFSFGIGWMF